MKIRTGALAEALDVDAFTGFGWVEVAEAGDGLVCCVGDTASSALLLV